MKNDPVDARVQIVEILWRDQEFQESVMRVIHRLFPHTDHLRADVLKALRECELLPKERPDAQA